MPPLLPRGDVAPRPTTEVPSTPAQSPTSPPPADSLPTLDDPAAFTAEERELVADADLHLLHRFSFGVPRPLADQVIKSGVRAWWDAQLDPDSIADSAADEINSWWKHLAWTPKQKRDAHFSGDIPAYAQNDDFARWTLLRRIRTNRQLLEVMTDFWSNLLHVPLLSKEFQHRPDFDRTIRTHALSSYRELLRAAITHPAILCFLDNADSTKHLPNENLGRELLELHTVGRASGYTETMVKASTRILTGWRVRSDGDLLGYYSVVDHDTEPVQVLDFKDRNRHPDGRDLTVRYLDYLARHESTARRIAHRLVVRFVGDTPPESLVDAVARAYLDNDTDIKATLRALVDHPDFVAGAQPKVRTPVEDLVNTVRVLQSTIKKPTGQPNDAATSILVSVKNMGQAPYDWPRPDGFPDVGDAWSSASRVLGSWRIHKNYATGAAPRVGIEHMPDDYWVGSLPARFDVVVDRVCRRLLSREATRTLQSTASKALGYLPGDAVVEGDRCMRQLGLLKLALLDTPDHMIR